LILDQLRHGRLFAGHAPPRGYGQHRYRLPLHAVAEDLRLARGGHALVLEDLDQVLDDLPEHLVIGTGAHGQMWPDQDTVQRLKARGVTVESLPTGRRRAATASWKPARTAPALHLTY
jgi:hypothetical protein